MNVNLTSSFLAFFLIFFFFTSASFLSSSLVFNDEVSTTITFGPLRPAGKPDMAEYPRAELTFVRCSKLLTVIGAGCCMGGVLRVPGRFSKAWSDSGFAGKYFLSGGAPWILVMEMPGSQKRFKFSFHALTNNYWWLGSICGNVGRAVNSNTRGPRLKSLMLATGRINKKNGMDDEVKFRPKWGYHLASISVSMEHFRRRR